MVVKVKKLVPDAVLPKKAHASSSVVVIAAPADTEVPEHSLARFL